VDPYRQVTGHVAAKEVLYNTVILSGSYPNAIEYHFPATKAGGDSLQLDGQRSPRQKWRNRSLVKQRDQCLTELVCYAAIRDLHLAASATAAIDKAAAHPSVPADYDAESRPQGSALGCRSR
jgi:hypothetical protein